MRIFNVGFIVLFMTMLIIPLVCIDLASGRASAEESRMLANPPELTDIKNHPGTFIRKFEDWFKDSTGFREQLITLYNAPCKNTWFGGDVYSDGPFVVLVGEEGHHYYMDNNGRLIAKFQGKQFLSDEQLSSMVVKLESVKTYLDGKNIPFIVMFCTNKETIYPEYVPKSIKPGPEPVQLDVITSYLQEHTSVDVFNIKNALLKEKNNYLLYMVSSGDLVHYNEIGAFFAYRELMKHINRYFPDITPFTLSDLSMTYDTARIPTVSLKAKIAYKKLDTSFFDDIYVTRPFVWEYAAYETTKSELPVILILCDSYAAMEQYIGKFLFQQFSKVICIHYRDIEHIYKYISRYRPDMVIFESAERQLEWFADNVAKIPTLP